MKSFIQEYGITTAVAVVIFALIGTSIFFRDTGGDSLKGFLNNYQAKAELIETADTMPTPEIKAATYGGWGSIQYEEGMTWEEWLASDYNTEGIEVWIGYIGSEKTFPYYVSCNSLDAPITGDEVWAELKTCFPAGTQVQVDYNGRTKNIEEIKDGDTVVAWDVEANEPYLTTVCETFQSVSCTISTVALNDGTILKLTPNHPMLVNKTWRSVDPGFNSDVTEYPSSRLCVGDIVTKFIGTSKVSSIKTTTSDERTPVYNISVISNNGDSMNCSYIANGIVVHNKPKTPIESCDYPAWGQTLPHSGGSFH